MNVVLFTGIVMFACSSLYFWLASRKEFNSAFLVSFITLISYIIMYEGRFLIGDPETGLYWTRWIFYGLSCALLTYEISKQLNIVKGVQGLAVGLTPIVMFTGTLASVYSGTYKWVWFVISSIAFLAIAKIYYSTKSAELPRISRYFLFGWSVFPIVFLFSPEGLNIINNSFAGIAYLVLDFFTKIIFYMQHSNLQKKSLI
jgi:bacteriorhodopsin